MRTKSMLLAAAALTTGLLSAQAQNVYSVNIVGYVNVVLKGNGAFTLVANPLSAPTNDMNTILPLGALPNKSQVLTWNGTGYNTAGKGGGVWSTNLQLPVGTGFFVKNGVAGSPDITNTFVGNVAVTSPGTNTTSVPLGFSLVGTVVPIGGNMLDTGNNTMNLGPVLNFLPNKSQILTWDNSGAGGYVVSGKGSGVWSTNLPLSVGQGFFINAKAATNWTQVLN